jgi:hypothetical protein
MHAFAVPPVQGERARSCISAVRHGIHAQGRMDAVERL